MWEQISWTEVKISACSRQEQGDLLERQAAVTQLRHEDFLGSRISSNLE